MASETTFRVIVVGGGLVGLTAAHILGKANIDFVVLEQHATISPYLGSLLSIMPTTYRIYDQVGILEPMSKVSDPIKHAFFTQASDGSVIREEHEYLPNLEVCCGHYAGLTHRASLTEALYMSMPEAVRSRILLNKRVAEITTGPHGVEVTCEDGSVEKGSIIIGADGVRSRVRHAMNNLRHGKSSSGKDVENSPYVTTYRNFFGDIPMIPGLTPCSNYEGVYDGLSTQILAGSKRSWFNVYEKLDTPTSDRIRYTKEDETKLLEKWGHLYMAPGYQLRDIYKLRTGHTGLINLEEGLVTEWSWDRIVLVGDAVRKLAPNAGWGYNMGVSDIVVLINGLRSLLETTKNPSTQALSEVFQEYQLLRRKDTLETHKISMDRIRAFAWLEWKAKFIVNYILPRVNISKIQWALQDQPLHSRAPVLYWLPETSLPTHKHAYKLYPPFELTSKQFKEWRPIMSSNSGLKAQIMFGLLVAAISIMGWHFMGTFYTAHQF